ncbi:MAG: RNA pseudouridine synthase [Pirellulaceae bacterium]|jgi:23S rRNA pseudouridine1911/1915/1917 synthase|nr:RNA pseudouridine synthase [Pirellulaceae bacterium]
MVHPPFHVLLEDNHLLAVVKPPNLPTMGVTADRPSLVTLARAYLKAKYHRPGNVYVGVVSRLDAVATGVVLLARTSKAASRLATQFRDRTVSKCYWALVPQPPSPRAGELVDWLRKDERQRKMVLAAPQTPHALEARLTYRTLGELAQAVLLEVDLDTGRKHQIRVQLAARGTPILGDAQYGSRVRFTPGIALHARSLQLIHPVRGTSLELVAPLPASWHPYGIR